LGGLKFRKPVKTVKFGGGGKLDSGFNKFAVKSYSAVFGNLPETEFKMG